MRRDTRVPFCCALANAAGGAVAPRRTRRAICPTPISESFLFCSRADLAAKIAVLNRKHWLLRAANLDTGMAALQVTCNRLLFKSRGRGRVNEGEGEERASVTGSPCRPTGRLPLAPADPTEHSDVPRVHAAAADKVAVVTATSDSGLCLFDTKLTRWVTQVGAVVCGEDSGACFCCCHRG